MNQSINNNEKEDVSPLLYNRTKPSREFAEKRF